MSRGLADATPAPYLQRVLGRVQGRAPGPTLIGVGGLHGNEPAGVVALQRVFEALEGHELPSGEFLALSGNRAALRSGQRFIDRDLNRSWTRDRVRALRNGGPPPGDAEVSEQRELLAALDAAVARARGTVMVLDLHTTSGGGGPFSTVADTLVNRELAEALPTPMILGLEELVEGTLLDYLNHEGLVTVGFESGQHAEPEAVDRAEAAVWITLEQVGLLPEGARPHAVRARAYLATDTATLPRTLEMRHRHEVAEGDGFRMRPGYRNFQPVSEGELLARDLRGEIRAPETARILMPLYQTQGDDGFFVVREFSTLWLALSRLLRKLPVARFVHWLPGITRSRRTPELLVVDRRIARLYALQLFHLLGYRRHREEGKKLLVMARHPLDRR